MLKENVLKCSKLKAIGHKFVVNYEKVTSIPIKVTKSYKKNQSYRH